VVALYKRILVPLDGSDMAEQVLPYVRLFAQGTGTRIELLSVIEPFPEYFAKRGPAKTADRVMATIRLEVSQYLENVATPLRMEGLSVSSTVQEGYPASVIVAWAREQQATETLVAMATHGRSGISRWTMGSVTEKVLLATDTPLLVVRSTERSAPITRARLNTLVVPLDGSALAEQVLPHAVNLAATLSLSVVLARVTPSPEDYAHYYTHPQEWFDELTREVDAKAAKDLEREASRLREMGASSVETRLLHGDPAQAIVNLAGQLPHSMVAMTTHGRSGINRWKLGSVADRVVTHSGSPVLMVRVLEPLEEQD
jgi:nucleotide-binding universal stress UspA family protein